MARNMVDCKFCHDKIFWEIKYGRWKPFEEDLIIDKRPHECPKLRKKLSRRTKRMKQLYGYLGIGHSA